MTGPVAGVATTGPAGGVKHAIFWRETEPVQPGPPLEGDVRCDVCIVGGGYTGLWTAHFLKLAEPSLDIHVVEADYAGAGASGHNDGFVTPTIGHSLHNVVHRFGPERAKAAYGVVGRSILELRRFCRKFGVEADLEPHGFYLVATSDAQRRRLDSDVELAARMGVRYEVLERGDARERIGSEAILGALGTPGGIVNPHKLARGLFRVVCDQGVAVHEQTRAISLAHAAGRHVVETPRGRVEAERLVLATNAYQHQFPAFRRTIMPLWSYAMVSEPLTAERLAQVHWPGREGFVEARNFVVFARLTADNRLLVGGGPAPYHFGRDMDEHRRMRNDRVFEMLRSALARYFPEWRDVPFTHAYGGCVAITRDFVPHVGGLGRGVYYGHGYCGNGIAMTHAAGKALRDLVLEADTDDGDLLYVRDREPSFPPEPLAFVGARTVSSALWWQDRHPDVVRRQFV